VFGTQVEFKVAHLTADQTWGGFRNNVQMGSSHDLNFNIASDIFAVGEWGGQLPPTSYVMTYGPVPMTPWQVRFDDGSYATINVAPSFDEDGHWGTGSLPSPFNISRN
jgi:hypothetical protein